jgi:hypothetical protein
MRHQAKAALAVLALTLRLAGAPAGAATCFDGQLPPAAWADAAALAAVRLVAALPDGHPFVNASGMVVAHSGMPNRILTAAHVARTMQERPGAWLAVYSSRGFYLGRASLAARAAPGPAFGLAGGGDAVGLRFGDAAVLRMSAFAPGGSAAYAAITGLPLGARQPRGLLEGVFSVPAGVDHGVSGAGVVADGAIVGVMVFKALNPAMPAVPVRGGDAGPAWAGPPRAIRLPRRATGYAQPVIDGTVLAGLGAAGRAVGGPRAAGPLSVFVPGYVQGACIGFRARMGPA